MQKTAIMGWSIYPYKVAWVLLIPVEVVASLAVVASCPGAEGAYPAGEAAHAFAEVDLK